MARTQPSPRIQYAALPWRRTKHGLEFLLITTLTTRRWIVPKGWPIKHCTPPECAAYEAFEEAGVIGTTATRAIGWFVYGKRRKSGKIVPCKVAVYPMEVVVRRRDWTERNARDSRWCSSTEALALIGEPGLQRLIAKFARLANDRSLISSARRSSPRSRRQR